MDKLLAASGPQSPDVKDAKSEKRGPVKDEVGDINSGGQAAEARDEAKKKAAEQHALRMAALAVLEESSEDNAKVLTRVFVCSHHVSGPFSWFLMMHWLVGRSVDRMIG